MIKWVTEYCCVWSEQSGLSVTAGATITLPSITTIVVEIIQMQRDLLTPLSLQPDAKLGEKHIFLAFIWGIFGLWTYSEDCFNDDLTTLVKIYPRLKWNSLQNPTNWLDNYLLPIDIINILSAKAGNSSKLISCYLKIECALSSLLKRKDAS